MPDESTEELVAAFTIVEVEALPEIIGAQTGMVELPTAPTVRSLTALNLIAQEQPELVSIAEVETPDFDSKDVERQVQTSQAGSDRGERIVLSPNTGAGPAETEAVKTSETGEKPKAQSEGKTLPLQPIDGRQITTDLAPLKATKAQPEPKVTAEVDVKAPTTVRPVADPALPKMPQEPKRESAFEPVKGAELAAPKITSPEARPREQHQPVQTNDLQSVPKANQPIARLALPDDTQLIQKALPSLTVEEPIAMDKPIEKRKMPDAGSFQPKTELKAPERLKSQTLKVPKSEPITATEMPSVATDVVERQAGTDPLPVMESRRVDVPPSTQLTLRPEVQRAVMVQLAQAQLKPDQPVELRLDPQELGQVRMVLTSQEQSLTLVMSAERPETLDLMRRHIDQLAQEFQEMGYTDLNFSFTEQESAPDQREGEHPPPRSTVEPQPAETTPHILNLGSISGLDIRM
ncbi:MAG: flagellar hook-length control protein FliK [Pseudomonadota bacterium]